MKYLKHFESNRKLLDTLVNSKNIRIDKEITSEWNINRVNSVFCQFDNIQYTTFFVTIKKYTYDSYSIYIKNWGDIDFEIKINTKNIIIDIKELLDNALLYYDNYTSGVIETLETHANFDKMIYSYKTLLEYNKKVEEMKKEYDYLFTGKDMGLL